MTRSEFRSWRAFSLVYPLLEALPVEPSVGDPSNGTQPAPGLDPAVMGAFASSGR